MTKIKMQNQKRSFRPVLKLWRDLAGAVHTPAGAISRASYERVVADNRDVLFPEYSEIPVRAGR